MDRVTDVEQLPSRTDIPSNSTPFSHTFRGATDGPGVDRLEITMPISTMVGPSEWGGRRRGRFRVDLEVGNGVAFLTAGPSLGGGKSASLDFNPSRILGDDLFLCPPSRVIETFDLVLCSGVLDRVGPIGSPIDARVRRVDVTRDFRVEDPLVFIEALWGTRSPYEKRRILHRDQTTGGVSGLGVSTGKQGWVNLYDRGLRVGLRDLAGLRWEAQCRSAWAARGGIRRVGDITEGAVRRLAADRWEWSRMGETIAGRSSVARAVWALDISPARKRSLLGHIVAVGEGIGDELKSGTLRHYTELKERLGFVLAQGDLPPARLDFEFGAAVPA
ncbi:MAG: hypothetical protein WD556_07800 [Actinomycetota bacterium]